MNEALLDTDILSEILKQKNPEVLAASRRYLAEHQRFAFSAITLYEVVRGFRAKRAERARAQFQGLLTDCEVLPISISVLHCAADLWAQAHQLGHPRDDADLIIAATAIETRRVLVTGNTAHFQWIPSLSLSDWRNVAG
jgi:tRNA(fMet)-specific endonuclease VapC